MDASISMKARFSVEGEKLQVAYTVVNNGTQTAYLLNRLFDTKPELKIRPDRVLVELGPGEVVHLAKRIPDAPIGRTVLSPYAPYVTPVPPGKQFEESFAIPLPIEPWWPSGYELLPRREKPIRRDFEQIDLRIDFYWSVEGVTENKATIGKDEVVLPVFPPGGKRPQFGSLRSEPFRLKVQVLDPRP